MDTVSNMTFFFQRGEEIEKEFNMKHTFAFSLYEKCQQIIKYTLHLHISNDPIASVNCLKMMHFYAHMQISNNGTHNDEILSLRTYFLYIWITHLFGSCNLGIPAARLMNWLRYNALHNNYLSNKFGKWFVDFEMNISKCTWEFPIISS